VLSINNNCQILKIENSKILVETNTEDDVFIYDEGYPPIFAKYEEFEDEIDTSCTIIKYITIGFVSLNSFVVLVCLISRLFINATTTNTEFIYQGLKKLSKFKRNHLSYQLIFNS